MLVLSRKQGDSIILGGNVKITVSAISRGRVKICIDAPRECAIRRTETLPVETLPADEVPLAHHGTPLSTG